jgi:hypothetical protein
MSSRWRPFFWLFALSASISAGLTPLQYKYYGLNPVFITRFILGAITYYLLAGLIPLCVWAIRKWRKSFLGYPYGAHAWCLIGLGAIIAYGIFYDQK